MPFTYIVRCADGTLYVGHTENLSSREEIHNQGKGAKYTASRRPVRMVYAEEHASVESAIARERQLKNWTNDKKEALIRGERRTLRALSRRSALSIQFTWRDLLNRNT
jgi:predicted GIY-YIG superfamily endonuclease